MAWYYLFAIGFYLLSGGGNSAEHTNTRDSMLSMIDDGCAHPIAGISAQKLAPFPQKCLLTFFADDGYLDQDIPARVLDWGSNGLGGKPWAFADDVCNQFFINLHARIATYMPNVALSPHDLFHGHLISYQRNGENHIAVLFHAKEYPRDREVIKNHYQVEQESFLSSDNDFLQRNYLYLSHLDKNTRNEILLVKSNGICAQYFSKQFGGTLSEENITKSLPCGKRLGDVNMFEAEKLSRIYYQFYPGFDPVTGGFILDYEGVETGKSVAERNLANQLMAIFIAYLSRPLVYFLTGRG